MVHSDDARREDSLYDSLGATGRENRKLQAENKCLEIEIAKDKGDIIGLICYQKEHLAKIKELKVALAKKFSKEILELVTDEGIAHLQAENKELKKWQIKPTEAICLTDLSCRYKKVFKND